SDTEVSQIDMKVMVVHPFLDEDVPGLHIAVHQAFAMRSVERSCRLPSDDQRSCLGDLALFFEYRTQVGARSVPHCYVQQILTGAQIVDRDNIRMVQRGSSTRLLQEPCAKNVIGGELGG